MIEIVLDPDIPDAALPPPTRIREAVAQTLRAVGFTNVERASLTLRLSDDREVRALNRQWRKQDKPTDVLAFPWQHGPEYTLDEYLGDIALAIPFVIGEARRLELPPSDHLIHLIVHGTLHLVGYDHAEKEDEQQMRTKERAIMRALKLHDPFPTWEEEEAR